MKKAIIGHLGFITAIALFRLTQGNAAVHPDILHGGDQAKNRGFGSCRGFRGVLVTIAPVNAPPAAGQGLADLLATPLRERKQIPPVSVGRPAGQPHERVVTTTLNTWEAGNASIHTLVGGGTKVKGELVLADVTRSCLYRLPVVCEPAGDVGSGVVGLMSSGMADLESVLKSAAHVSAMPSPRPSGRNLDRTPSSFGS